MRTEDRSKADWSPSVVRGLCRDTLGGIDRNSVGIAWYLPLALHGNKLSECDRALDLLSGRAEYIAAVRSILDRHANRAELDALDAALVDDLDRECKKNNLSPVVSTILARLERLNDRITERAAELARALCERQLRDGSWSSNPKTDVSQNPADPGTDTVTVALAVYALSKWSTRSCTMAKTRVATDRAIDAGRQWLLSHGRRDSLWVAGLAAAEEEPVDLGDSSLALIALAHGYRGVSNIASVSELLELQLTDGSWPENPVDFGLSEVEANVQATAQALNSLMLARNWLAWQSGLAADKRDPEVAALVRSLIECERPTRDAIGQCHELLGSRISNACSWLVVQQRADGGWSQTVGDRKSNSSLLATCLVIPTLIAAQSSVLSPTLSRALNFVLNRHRTDDSDGTAYWNPEYSRTLGARTSATALATSVLARSSSHEARAIVVRGLLWLLENGDTESTRVASRQLCCYSDYMRLLSRNQ